MSRGQSTGKQEAGSQRDLPTGDIVVVDQRPLRDRVAAKCSDAMSRLERVRARWHHFERKDKPAFARWRARGFGALLSKAREVEMQIRDSQTLVHEVEMEMRRGFQDAHSAYQRVMFRRANPAMEPVQEEFGAARDRHGAVARKLTDFEKEALFQEWVRRSLGTNPDKMDDEAYSATFEAFKSHMFRTPVEESRPRNAAPRAEREGPVRPAQPSPAPEPPQEADARVKELYRRLVRRLHPDPRADGSAAVSALWHEMQEAYAASDVPRMEILLALSDIEARRTADQSLSQMHAVLAELERAWRALEKSLLEAEGEDAWNFARIGPSADLRLRVERQLKSDLAGRTRRLDLLTRTIAEWAQGPVANRMVRVNR
jgi:hypothetical protein